MKTNMNITINTLNGHYLSTGEKINAEYLCDSVVMWAMNTQSIYNSLVNGRQKIHSVVWMALTDLANDHLRFDGVQCTSTHLKKWLDTYGNGYDTLSQAIEELQEAREEATER